METLIQKEIGSVSLTVRLEDDEHAEHDYLGEYCAWKPEPETYLYDRSTGNMYDGKYWRDERGRLAAEPEDYSDWNREYRFIDIGSCQFSRGEKHSLKYAFQNARRLEDLGQTWQYAGVVATVTMNGREIGYAAVWGFEVDWRGVDSYIASEAREIASEALTDAKRWLRSVCA